jgi:hypothetical protein
MKVFTIYSNDKDRIILFADGMGHALIDGVFYIISKEDAIAINKQCKTAEEIRAYFKRGLHE